METYILPAFWVFYLTYGDTDGMTDEEVQEVDKWTADKGTFISADCDEYFAHYNDANNVGGNVMKYTFQP